MAIGSDEFVSFFVMYFIEVRDGKTADVMPFLVSRGPASGGRGMDNVHVFPLAEAMRGVSTRADWALTNLFRRHLMT